MRMCDKTRGQARGSKHNSIQPINFVQSIQPSDKEAKAVTQNVKNDSEAGQLDTSAAYVQVCLTVELT